MPLGVDAAGAQEILQDIFSPTAVAVGHMMSALTGLCSGRKFFAAREENGNLYYREKRKLENGN
jgi:hypothetical protein